MPYLFEKKHIQHKDDKRRKLSESDKEEIRFRYLKIGGVSQRELAREYEVSRRLIVFCIYPERLKANLATRTRNGGSKAYYNREKHTEAMQRHREHKKQLHKEGKLI